MGTFDKAVAFQEYIAETCVLFRNGFPKQVCVSGIHSRNEVCFRNAFPKAVAFQEYIAETCVLFRNGFPKQVCVSGIHSRNEVCFRNVFPKAVAFQEYIAESCDTPGMHYRDVCSYKEYVTENIV